MAHNNTHDFVFRDWLAGREKKYQKNRVFLKRLNRSKLDFRLIQDIHDQVFEQIDCLQCGNCCKTANPIFTQTDVKRISAFLGMKEGKFEEKFLRFDAEDDLVPIQIPCPFLDPDNTCQIYDLRPKSCRSFPHTDSKEGWQRPELLAKNTLTCPAAYRIVSLFSEKFNSNYQQSR